MSDKDDLGNDANDLFRGPIIVDADETTDTLAMRLEERLADLLEFYDCDATPDGWKELALKMALTHSIDGKRVMEVVGLGVRPEKSPGAPRGRNWILYGMRIEAMMRMHPEKLNTALKSAKFIKKNDKNIRSSIRTMQNNYTRFKKEFVVTEDPDTGILSLYGRTENEEGVSDCDLDEALNLAAQNLESKSRE